MPQIDWFAPKKENIFGHKKKLDFLAQELLEFTRSRGKVPGEIKVLDLGCGNCEAVTFPLASLGFDLTGVDMFAPAIEYARAKNPYPNLQLVLGDLHQLEFAGKFDAIVAADILY